MTWGDHFTPAFWHILVKFMEEEPSTKFYGVLITFQKVMKFRSWVELDISDVIRMNVHNMRFQLFKMYWDKSLFGLGVQKILFLVVLGSFFVLFFMFLVYVGKFNLWWAEMTNCDMIYCSNTTGKTPDKISYFPFPNPKT